jgi:wyosine [tRNA(Phe)-imidazoG37] synthetase (radical SAM superfamily)
MMTTQDFLVPEDHNRDVSGLTYIYPVVSRRAGGVSIGVNLNVNNACNWRCVYCQVPNLKRGSPDQIDLVLLEKELRGFLNQLLHGDFMEHYVAVGDRHLKDIAFSGNGEPTSAKEFPQVITIVEKVLHDLKLLDDEHPIIKDQPIKVRLITNGSLMDKDSVLNSVRHLAKVHGEVWFKVDGGTPEDVARINDVNINIASVVKRLKACAAACPTFVQTCMFGLDGNQPSESHISAYIELLAQVKTDIKGVHLYGLARPSYQVEAPRLSRLSAESLEKIAAKIRVLGLPVFVSP